MAKDKDNKNNAPNANTETAPAETPKTRTRLSFSKEKKLAYLVVALVGILTSKPVAAVLTEEQKTKVTKAQKAADEVGGGDVLKPVTDRIAAIQKELAAIDWKKPELLNQNSAQAKELAADLDRQIKRKKQIEDMIGG